MSIRMSTIEWLNHIPKFLDSMHERILKETKIKDEQVAIVTVVVALSDMDECCTYLNKT